MLMGNGLAEEMKNTVADLLGYYGFSAEADYEMPVFSDYIDVAAMKADEEYPKMVVFCSPGKEKIKFISKLAKHSSVEDVVVLEPEYSKAEGNRVPGNVHVFDQPDIDHTGFEDFISSFSPKKPSIPYFSTVPGNQNPPNSSRDALLNFEELIRDQGLDVAKAKYEIYRTAISGMNLRYGRYISLDDGNPVFERNRELTREAILLKAAGYLREEKLPDRGLGLDSDGNSFLVLSDQGETAYVSEAIVDEYVHNRRQIIKRIMEHFPKMFSYIALVGTLGYFAPKTMLSIERHRRSWSGVIRTTAQSENSYLVEAIRTMMNTVGVTEEEWNRINCLASFGEINSIMREYFEKFEKAGIGIYGYRGLKRIYLPAKRISVLMHLEGMHDELDMESLEEFCIYDAILRSNRSDFDFRSMVKDLGLDQKKLANRISRLAKLGYCSKLLPENSDLPIAIYNQGKFANYCLKVMREMASNILDVEW